MFYAAERANIDYENILTTIIDLIEKQNTE